MSTRRKWPRVIIGFGMQLAAPLTKTFALTTSALLPGPARLQINVWGSTAAPANPDHAYRLVLNDQAAGRCLRGTGRGTIPIEAEIPAGVLREGSNVLNVIAPGVPQVDADITYLNWIALDYPRAFVAQDDRLAFESPGGVHHLTGFSGPIEVFDVTQPDRPVRTRGECRWHVCRHGRTSLLGRGAAGVSIGADTGRAVDARSARHG